MKKEWEKDIKMSYTEAYHRPHRNTWEDYDKMKRDIDEGKFEDCPDRFKEYMNRLYDSNLDQEKEEEYKRLQEKKIMSQQEKNRYTELSYSLGYFPGALADRNRSQLEKIASNRLPPEPIHVIRLHLELYDDCANDVVDDTDAETLRIYGQVEYGRSISRDIIVPYEMPLYAIHYMIQRAFGWQNSHLHKFELPDDRFYELINNSPLLWRQLVGIVFRSPFMNEEDEFWADDYTSGSIKNWLKKKYTGPYISRCQAEGILSCKDDMKRLDGAQYYVMYETMYNNQTAQYDGEEILSEVYPVWNIRGDKNPEPKPWGKEKIPYRVEIRDFSDIPSTGLEYITDYRHNVILERLPICSVLATGKYGLPAQANDREQKYIHSQIIESGEVLFRCLEPEIESICNNGIDSPTEQVIPFPITDELLYHYDFGDNWKIRITASENCNDLIEYGRITQEELDRANVKCRETYRPVLIARDGDMVMDNVGGISGFVDFLNSIHPDFRNMNPEEVQDAKDVKSVNLTWAKSMGWHKDKSTDFNLL